MKVAVCGTWHVHASHYANVAKMTDGVEVVGVYEENEQWKNEFAKVLGIPAFDTFEDLLASDADMVIVCTPTNKHTYYICKIAEAKKDIFTEKVLALTVVECEQVKKAVEDNGVKFVISFVHKCDGGVRTVKKLVADGAIGRVNYVRFRNAHGGSFADWLPEHFYNKEECGGGAMIDLGAHGMYLINDILGLPEKYSTTFNVYAPVPKNRDMVEDHVVTVMSYKNGAIAINETGFVSPATPCMLEVGGESGFVCCSAERGVELSNEGTEYELKKIERLDDIAEPLEQMLAGKIADGCGIDEATDLTRMMVGVYGK